MKKLTYALLLFLLLLGIAFFSWRRKAPSYQGQDLHVVRPGEGSVELLLIGDMGTGDEHQDRIAEAMNRYCQENPLAAVIFLGDNFYPHGVKTTKDEQWETTFRKPYGRDCLRGLPFYAVLGNHDYKGNPAAQIEYKSEDPSWNMPHRFFDIRFGSLLTLTMLDTNILDVCGFSTYCTIDFMLKSLEEANTRFKIVLGHHPIVSSSAKYSQNFQGHVFERVLCGRAHYYIAGHSHHLEHLSSAQCSEPLDYFVVGGGGADLYDIKTWRKETKFAASTFGFMALKVDDEQMRFRFLDNDLKILYETVKSKREEDAAPEAAPVE